METLERNKANVIAFYELMFNDCKPRDAVELYAGADYIQHNPHGVSSRRCANVMFEEALRMTGIGAIEPRTVMDRLAA